VLGHPGGHWIEHVGLTTLFGVFCAKAPTLRNERHRLAVLRDTRFFVEDGLIGRPPHEIDCFSVVTRWSFAHKVLWSYIQSSYQFSLLLLASLWMLSATVSFSFCTPAPSFIFPCQTIKSPVSAVTVTLYLYNSLSIFKVATCVRTFVFPVFDDFIPSFWRYRNV